MSFNKPYIQTTNVYSRKDLVTGKITRTIYYGNVVDINDTEDGGRIKVRITDLDNKTATENLPWCYPLLPKFFHLYPQVGEAVRIFIGDSKQPEGSRFWLGNIISQPQKFKFETYNGALSTTEISLSKPEPAIYTFPDAKGVFPDKLDIGLVGRVNTDIILKENQVHLRAGKHENGNVYKLNSKNPSSISLVFEEPTDSNVFQSNTIVMSDKIALISHTGTPRIKPVNQTTADREEIFKTAHPIARGDVLVQALDIIRNALINHIHGYSNLSADKNEVINELEKINFESILQKNIVIN